MKRDNIKSTRAKPRAGSNIITRVGAALSAVVSYLHMYYQTTIIRRILPRGLSIQVRLISSDKGYIMAQVAPVACLVPAIIDKLIIGLNINFLP